MEGIAAAVQVGAPVCPACLTPEWLIFGAAG
jgi:hypothetical protein